MRGRSSSSGASLKPEAVPNDQDPYLYPGTDVLRNKPGIVVAEVLAAFEYEQSAKRIEELRGKPVSGRFDLKHLQDIHRAISQDVYEWAGELRTVAIMKATAVSRSLPGLSAFSSSPWALRQLPWPNHCRSALWRQHAEPFLASKRC